MRILNLNGKITGQKLIDGKIYMVLRCGIYDYMFLPKSLKQQMFLMKLKEEESDLYVRAREKSKGNKTVSLIRVKALTERDKEINRLIRNSKTKKHKRTAQEARYQIEAARTQIGTASKHHNSLTRGMK